MKLLYFDCFSGISGDMTIGSLIDLGVDPEYVICELKKLKLEKEYSIEWRKVLKNGISATKFDVIFEKQEHPTDHHTHSHRHYHDIVSLIEKSDLNDRIKRMSLSIFEEIAIAEGKIHQISVEKVHFHEVGAIDSIVDIVSTAIAIESLDVDVISSSPVPVGSGKIFIEHGIYPVPAPATLEILKKVPIQQSDISIELTTPTGAAIISTLAQSYSTMPSMKVMSIGYGAGTKDLEKVPNVLRIVLGEIG